MLPSANEVGRLMVGHGFEQVLAIPAMPNRSPGTFEAACGVNDDRGQSWCLRTSTTSFDLIGKACLRTGMTRCYSLGWGLTVAGQVPHLLLVQAFCKDRSDCSTLLSNLTTGLRRHGTILLTNLDVQWGLRCLRLAASLGDTDEP